MRGRAVAWLAWSLLALSGALLVGGISLARMMRSTAPEIPYGSEADPGNVVSSLVTLLTFSVVGAIIASRQPRNAIGWFFCGVGLIVGFNSLAGGYAEYWLAGGSGPGSLAETAAWFSSWSWSLLVYIPTSFLLLLFPTVGCLRRAGVPSPGARRSGSWAMRWRADRSGTSRAA
jgi:hypothetical protein